MEKDATQHDMDMAPRRERKRRYGRRGGHKERQRNREVEKTKFVRMNKGEGERGGRGGREAHARQGSR